MAAAVGVFVQYIRRDVYECNKPHFEAFDHSLLFSIVLFNMRGCRFGDIPFLNSGGGDVDGMDNLWCRHFAWICTWCGVDVLGSDWALERR